MRMLLKVLFSIASIQLFVALAPYAQEICPGCGDKAPIASVYEVKFENRCEESVWLALHYAPGEVPVTEGWWELKPRKTATFESYSQFIGWYAQSGNSRWFGDRNSKLRLAIDPIERFSFEGYDPPRKLKPARFVEERLSSKRVTAIAIICN